MLDATPLAPGQSYATVADIRDCQDLPKMPVTPGVRRVADGGWEPLWTRPDGSPLTILLRAPSFEERRLINQVAGESDDTFTIETCFYCIAEPTFSREQLKEILQNKHPLALDQIRDTAWSLAELPAEMVEREIRRLAGLPKEPTQPKRPRKRAVA